MGKQTSNMSQDQVSDIYAGGRIKWLIGGAAALVFGSFAKNLMSEEHCHDSTGTPEKKLRLSGECDASNWFGSQFFINKDGLAIFWRKWVPPAFSKPKGIVIISHGLAEHSGRYELLGIQLSMKGYAVYALDHQGHGQSEGTRLYVKWFSDFIDDIHQLTELAKKQNPEVTKCFLLGHSMGALIAIHAVHTAPKLYNAVILSAPPLKLELPPMIDVIGPAIASLFPKAPSPGIDISTLCNDKSVVDRYMNDPLCITNESPKFRLTSEIILNSLKVPEFSAQFPIPYLLMHGTGDKICLIDGSVNFHGKTEIAEKRFVAYDGAFHELFNEPDSEQKAMKDTFVFLDLHVTK